MDGTESRKIRWYEVAYVVILVGVLVWSVFFRNPHKVAVVDIDRVVKDVGMVQKMEKERAKMEAFTKASALLKGYETRVKGLKEKYETAASQADKDKLMAQLKAADEQFNQSVAPLQGELQQYNVRAVATFRKRIKPFIDQVALKNGADLVMMETAQLLFVRNSVDLTDEVIAASKEFFAKDMPVIDPAMLSAGPAR